MLLKKKLRQITENQNPDMMYPNFLLTLKTIQSTFKISEFDRALAVDIIKYFSYFSNFLGQSHL